MLVRVGRFETLNKLGNWKLDLSRMKSFVFSNVTNFRYTTVLFQLRRT